MFNSIITAALTPQAFAICLCAALLLGCLTALVYMRTVSTSKGFATTLALLPSIVAVVIMMVNGNIGAGVAVAGAFSLVRFRSAAGTAKEIGAIFLGMAVGLACGMGYIAFAAIFCIVLCGMDVFYSSIRFGEKKGTELDRDLKITVPEDLEFYEMFDDVFRKYTTEARLTQVKTAGLGSLNKLEYTVRLKEEGKEKQFIDELRCRNGNLEISMSLMPQDTETL